MGELSQSQGRAVIWLYDRGSEGVIDRYGRVVAAGEVAKQFAPETWLRLVAKGLLVGGHGRIWLNGVGLATAQQLSEKAA